MEDKVARWHGNNRTVPSFPNQPICVSGLSDSLSLGSEIEWEGETRDGGQTPDFYEDPQDLPPAPPFLKWMAYKSDVPPLPSVASILGPAFVKYKWLYDYTFRVHSYTFTSFDKVLPALPRFLCSIGQRGGDPHTGPRLTCHRCDASQNVLHGHCRAVHIKFFPPETPAPTSAPADNFPHNFANI